MEKVYGTLFISDWVDTRWMYYKYHIKNFTIDIFNEIGNAKYLNIRGIGKIEVKKSFQYEYEGRFHYGIRCTVVDKYQEKDYGIDIFDVPWIL